MNIILLTLPLALLLAICFIVAFVISVKFGQYDDLETPSYKMLLGEEKHIVKKRENENE